MRILILDRYKEQKSNSRQNAYWVRKFKKLGYYVTSAKSLRNISNKLGTYNIAFVHPRLEDYSKLKEEASKRDDFQLILFSNEPLHYELHKNTDITRNFHFYDLVQEVFLPAVGENENDAFERIYHKSKLRELIDILWNGLEK